MEKIKVIVNGLPGKMAMAIAESVVKSDDLELLPHSLTGPEVTDSIVMIGSCSVVLYTPDQKDFLLGDGYPDIIIDFTTPSAIKDNVDFYVSKQIPFVLGTTGGDLEYINHVVSRSVINAVVAPNMAKEIVAFQAMMEFAAENFPDIFKDFSLSVTESHQKTKADTSGTAKAVVKCFNKLGIPFSVNDIDKKRTEEDYHVLGIRQKFWEGHGWHTYSLKKSDGSVFMSFTHNVNGREAYVDGTLTAARFLHKTKNRKNVVGQIYSMVDVIGF